MLQTHYRRGTNDGDILETRELDAATQARLLDLAGPKSAIQKRHGLYIDIVKNGIPFLPQVPLWRPARQLHALEHLDVLVLDIVDVVVAKLKR